MKNIHIWQGATIILGLTTLYFYSRYKREKKQNDQTYELVKNGELQYHPKK